MVLDQAELGDIIICLKQKLKKSVTVTAAAIESIALVVRMTDEDAGTNSNVAILWVGDNIE